MKVNLEEAFFWIIFFNIIIYVVENWTQDIKWHEDHKVST